MTGQRGRVAKLEARQCGPGTERPPVPAAVWPELAVWLTGATPEQRRGCAGLAVWLNGGTA
jgi:hypothetical protein